LTDLAFPNDFTLLFLLLFTFGTFDDLDLADLDLDDLLATELSVFRLFKKRVFTSPEVESVLPLPLATDLVDFNALILGTFDDFPLILLAFLILTDLFVTFKLFADFTLPEAFTGETVSNAIAMKAKKDLYLLHMIT
jgi:hypothetical protein